MKIQRFTALDNESTRLGEESSNHESSYTSGSKPTLERYSVEITAVNNKKSNGWRPVSVVFAVCLIYFAEVYAVVGSGAYAQEITKAFGDTSGAVWFSSIIAIATTVLSPPVSEAADYWGRRWFLIGLTMLGAVGSIIIARSCSVGMVIAGTVILGFSSGAQPLTAAVVSEVIARKHRPHAQAACNIAASLGGIVALMAGESLVKDRPEGFRNFWYISTTLYILAAIVCFLVYRPLPQHSQLGLTDIEKLKKLDWPAYALMTSSLVLFSTGLSWGLNPYAWSDARVLAPLIVGMALVSVLAVYTSRFKRDGMFHHDLFKKNCNFVISLICIFVEGLVFFAANSYFAI